MPQYGQGHVDGYRLRYARGTLLSVSPKFVVDFVAAWNKVMNLDRFDLA